MSRILTTDNNLGKFYCQHDDLDNLSIIANLKIGDIKKDNIPNLLVFPQSLSQTEDGIDGEYIFSLKNNELTTNNIMGFVGVNDTKITIKSRFAKNCDEDYFLHYMLQKVFSINLFDLKHNTNTESIFDFLLYLFPYFLKRAVRQGIYKEYTKHEYNDANVRGVIDVSRHIRQNIPFSGKIAYRTREYCCDNALTQLVRHTLEYIRRHQFGGNILNNDEDTRKAVSQIEMTTLSYVRQQRQSVINQNIRPIQHPYFRDYIQLQSLCLQILRHEEIKYGAKKDEIYGILFDGAWLWEEYLNTILKECGFMHAQNKSGKDGIYLFEEQKNYKRYPDFYKDNIILDAKYKHLESGNIDRNDIHQIISYMYVEKAENGGLIFPCEQDTGKRFIGKLRGNGGEIFTCGFVIPKCDNFRDFCSNVLNSEIELKRVCFSIL
jgi:5-methylcytosine-specific restriction enzyme subunit McrC